jgi:hypothetical protein
LYSTARVAFNVVIAAFYEYVFWNFIAWKMVTLVRVQKFSLMVVEIFRFIIYRPHNGKWKKLNFDDLALIHGIFDQHMVQNVTIWKLLTRKAEVRHGRPLNDNGENTIKLVEFSTISVLHRTW